MKSLGVDKGIGLSRPERVQGERSGISRNPQLIFLLSLPRSGSTLLERILRAHQDIAAASEPHILLYLLLSLYQDGMYSLATDREYHLRAMSEFIAQLPDGEEDYFEEVAEFARRLFGRHMTSPATHFLDKSPGYCFVATRLLRLSSEDKHVFLWRNPLAVAASFLKYPGENQQRWNLYRQPHLYDGLREMIRAYEQYRERVFVVRSVMKSW